MFPYQHFIFGVLFIGGLFLIYPSISLMGLGIILASSVLIDVDHYIYYAYKKKDLNFFKARKWFFKNLHVALNMSREERNKLEMGVMIFHGVEMLAILFVLGFFASPYFFFVFIGFGFHLVLDVLFNLTLMDRMLKISLVRDLIR